MFSIRKSTIYERLNSSKSFARCSDLFTLSNSWQDFPELCQDDFSRRCLIKLIDYGLAEFGLGDHTIPIFPRLYFEEQFPLMTEKYPLSDWLSRQTPNIFWIGLPLNNLFNLHQSTTAGLARIINYLPEDLQRLFFGILPYSMPNEKCLRDLHSFLGVAKSSKTRLGILGGDHRVAWAVMKQLRELYPGQHIRYIHIDAHHDLYGIENYSSRSILAHSNFLVDLLFNNSVDEAILVGCRDNHQPINSAHKMNLPVIAASSFEQILDSNKAFAPAVHTHLSIDIDVLDPSYAPDVSCPLPNGWSPQQLNEEIDLIFQSQSIDSVSLVEVGGTTDTTAKLAAKIAVQL